LGRAPTGESTLHDDLGIIERLANLVRIPGHPAVPKQEESVVRELSTYLCAKGIE
jgi:hypothetical protein